MIAVTQGYAVKTNCLKAHLCEEGESFRTRVLVKYSQITMTYWWLSFSESYKIKVLKHTLWCPWPYYCLYCIVPGVDFYL